MLNNILNIFQGLILIKIAFLIICALYVVFLFILHNQTKAMERVINDDGASAGLDLISLVNAIAGISLFVAALIIL